ncbi:uncharacterized protein LOC116108850 isoform X2 [Pistacia vera]|uniref:uncharacterized protein LOC116108850 isoform X2 n=1 Tax=Pistacia vera TaxID=55513 RepID=UPI001263A1E9|nr:uncharacterized protein LOC116108850 isoform X2 [Pistacia vera]
MSVPLVQLAPNLTVSKLCFGTMTFGEQNSASQSFHLLDQAFDAGINFFDSAEMYPVPQRAESQGRSEEYFGRWFRERKIPRDQIVFASKEHPFFGSYYLKFSQVSGPSGQMTWIRGGPECLDARNITEAIDNSLERTQMDYIDLYQIHWPDRYVPMFGETQYDPTKQYTSIGVEEQLVALAKAVDAGKIRYIGLSNETPYGVMMFLRFAEKVPHYPKILSVQNSYNLLCRTFDSGLAECCHHERIWLLAYSPLAMGILSGKYFSPDGGPADARLNLFKGKYLEGESRYNLSNSMVKAATMEYLDVARRYGLHPVSLAIAFVLRHPLVASAVFGATKSSQLQEVINACQVELTAEIVAEINGIHARFPNPCP